MSRDIFLENVKPKAERPQAANLQSSVGEKALWGAGVFVAELGVNDPLTHLEQYLESGEAAINSVDEDLVTDCAERLEKPRFINSVAFDRTLDDFISRENQFSMRGMTTVTEYKFAGNAADMRLYARAKIESKEVGRLSGWFDGAGVNDVYVVESMPMTDKETYAIVRIHQKVSEMELVEHVVTLHNSSVGAFNQLHDQIGADVPPSQTAMELLDNMYAYSPPHGDFEEFMDTYVSTYDAILADQNPGQEFSFGLKKTEHPATGDDIAMVRRQKVLRGVYLDSLRALGSSGGYITDEIAEINWNLGLGLDTRVGHAISSNLARELLDHSLQYVVATLNKAPRAALDQLAISGNKSDAVESAGYYGGEAKSEGIRYDGACPTGTLGAANTEASTLSHAYRMNGDPTKCVTCPKCKETVDLPKELLKKNIMHCVNCKASVHTKGGKVSSKIIDEFYGKKTKNEGSKRETELQRINRQIAERKLAQRRRRIVEEAEAEQLGGHLLSWIA
ncbi:hypothetical protein HY857_02095 [Candidatus Saccharibacteria bacterium]|nr:hypothetical protein [Candidatus Saccharibacteria bacterium]